MTASTVVAAFPFDNHVIPTRIAAIDYKGLILYAKPKGVEPYEIDDEEKEKFVLS